MKHNQFEKLREMFGGQLKKYEPESICGIYFHVKDGTVEYVGRTVNLHVRHTGWREARRQGLFDDVHYITVAEEHLDRIETELITLLRPIRNQIMVRNGKCQSKFMGPLPLDLTIRYLANPMSPTA